MLVDGALAALVAQRIPGLRAALLFGSCLADSTRSPQSIPDVFALVDDLGAALRAFGCGTFRCWLARPLAPATVPLTAAGEEDGPAVAKVTLATPATVAATLARLPDLSIAGRLSKKTRLLWARDQATRDELGQLLEAAADAMARTTLLGLPRRIRLAEAAERCFSLSYRAEPRPEQPAQIALRYQAFADHYRAEYSPRLEAAARAAGISVVDGTLVDGRPDAVRAAETRALARLLRRARWRSGLRFLRQPLLYRGWLPYLRGKLARARAARSLRGSP